MEIQDFEDPGRFRAAALPFLLAHEVENNVQVGVTSNLAMGGQVIPGSASDGPMFWVIRDSDGIQGTGMHTPPFPLNLSYPFSDGASTALMDHLRGAGRKISGVNGPTEACDLFARRWAALEGVSAEVERNSRIYWLDQVVFPPAPPGKMILAAAAHQKALVPFMEAFQEDTGESQVPAPAAIKSAITGGRLYCWWDGALVSMAGWTRGTPNGACITMVYTPPDHRQRGYASALVASLSQRLLNQGRAMCFLFTNLANPISNSIYQKIGYRAVIDNRGYRFAG